MRKIDISRAVVLCILFFSSCVREDMSNCVTSGEDKINSRVLHFKTMPEKYDFTELVESVRLYVYDDDEDRFLKTYRDVMVDELLSAEYGVILSEWEELPDDNYHIIGVMNPNDHYEISNYENLDSYETRIIRNEYDEIDEDLNDIFIGYIKLDPVLTKTVYRDTVYLEKLTNRIYVTVEFEDFELPAGTELVSYITGSNGEYNYMNNSLGATTMTYKPHFYGQEHETMFKYNLTTGKLYIEDDLELHIIMYNAHGIVEGKRTINLTDTIAGIRDDNGNYLYNTNTKLQAEDEFYLHILLNGNFEILSLNVNNWYLVDPGIDL